MIFRYKHIAPGIIRPIIQIILKSDQKFIIDHALVDSGADYSIFDIQIARVLGVKLSKNKTEFVGIKGTKIAGFVGKVTICVGETNYNTTAIFASLGKRDYDILGQKGFFDHFYVKLSYHNQEIEIVPVKTFNKRTS